MPYLFYIRIYPNTLDTVVMFLILNAREQIIRLNVYVRKILKETEQWNVYQKGSVRKKTVGTIIFMWLVLVFISILYMSSFIVHSAII